MKRLGTLKTIGTAATAAAVIPGEIVSKAPDTLRPNIIFMIVDNLGSEAIDYYGPPTFDTPRLNAMARSGNVHDHTSIPSQSG